MNEIPDHIKAIRLEIWLSKTPAERIRQFCIENYNLVRFLNGQKSQPVAAAIKGK